MVPQTARLSVRRPRGGFTLIEVLLVVVIMAILAGTILSRFLSTADDAKASAMKHNLSVAQAQIEIYRAQHKNCYPTIQNGGLPQLTGSTNSDGQIGPAGPTYPCGPYLMDDPVNPFDGSKKVAAVAKAGQTPTEPVGALGGWQYDVTTGALWPNNSEWYK